MKTKTVYSLLLILLILGILGFGALPRTARASGTIYIWPDGSIDPPTAPIQRVGSVYTFTADIYDSIEVKAFNIIIDGDNFKLQGPGTGIGFNMFGSADVTIRNTIITGWSTGISFDSVFGGAAENNVITNNSGGVYLSEYRDVSLSGNTLTNNVVAIGYLYFYGASITNNSITNNYMGIGGHGLSNSNVTGNNISDNTDIGVLLYDARSNNVTANSIEHNRVGVLLSAEISATNNRIFDNTVAYNDYGFEIGRYQYGGSQLVGNNFIYHNNFLSNAQTNAIVNGTSQINHWDNGYPSGGNFWSDYNGVDFYSGPYQNLTGSDGIGDTAYTLDSTNRDDYPFVNLWTPQAHDIAAVSVAPSKQIVGQGFNVTIVVIVTNQGSYSQTVRVTAYTNTTTIQTNVIVLASGDSETLWIEWNTTGFTKGNWTISTYVDQIPGEVDVADNTCIDGVVRVITPGDVNADGKVNILDAAGVSAHWYLGPPIGPLGYDPNFDINNDSSIGILDAAIVSEYWTGPPKGPKAP